MEAMSDPVNVDGEFQETDVVDDGALQERMDSDDDPWYSPSEGAVVDRDGNVLVDEEGNSFTSLDEYTAKQTKEKAEEPKESEPEGPVDVTPDTFKEFTAPEYSYSDDLVPQIVETEEGTGAEDFDPVEIAREEKDVLVGHMIDPINKIAEKMVSEGVPEGVVKSFLAPIIQEQEKKIEEHYGERYQTALEEKLGRGVQEKLTKQEEEARKNDSRNNISKLSRAYYPELGEKGFFSLVNGENTKSENGEDVFKRGPSAEVLDLLVSVANDGKSFKSEDERTKAYVDTFTKLTADEAKAKSLFNIAHFYWLGRKAVDLQKASYKKGIESAKEKTELKRRTVKTPPASYRAPSTESDNVPEMWKILTKNMR